MSFYENWIRILGHVESIKHFLRMSLFSMSPYSILPAAFNFLFNLSQMAGHLMDQILQRCLQQENFQTPK